MDNQSEKASLRRLLLERRDSISYELQQISSKQIHQKLKKIPFFSNARSIGVYYQIGSEVSTVNILEEILKLGKDLSLPIVIGENLQFKKISSLSDLQKRSFSIMEPKENCPDTSVMDVILVPAIGMTRQGQRLGYGYGYYDRYLASTKSKTIALVFSKQVVKKIPKTDDDIKIDYVITEEKIFNTSNVS